MNRPIYEGIIQKLDIAELWVLTGCIVKLKHHHSAGLIPRVEEIGWNIESYLGSNDWPVSTEVESIDIDLTLLNKQISIRRPLWQCRVV